MNRRALLISLTGVPVAMLPGVRGIAKEPALDALRARWREFVPDTFESPSPEDPVVHSEQEWREILEPERFRVLREEATEPSNSSPLNAEKRAGIYVCAGCDLPLFTSEMKFESGTGWPSFFTTIPNVFETKRDFVWFIPRTEYHCVRCGGHHGHVFDDGPAPTYERWCNNGLALRFHAA